MVDSRWPRGRKPLEPQMNQTESDELRKYR
jgi:hypothetical protein